MISTLILVAIALLPVLVNTQQEFPGLGSVEEIIPEVKQIFQTAYLNCTVVKNFPTSRVQWRKVPTRIPIHPSMSIISDEEVVIWDEYKYAVKIRNVGDKSTYTLEIKYLEEADAGEYMCILEIVGMRNFEQYYPRKTGNLTVQSVPVTIDPEPTCKPINPVVDQFTYRGLSAKLQCIITGNPPPAIKWMKESENGDLIEILDDDQYDITEKDINVKEFILSTLLVKKVEFVGFDNYVCRGDNSHGRAEASIRLNKLLKPGIVGFTEVSALPEIVGDILPDIKKEGETAYLNCTVANKGYDTVVMWARHGRSYDESDYLINLSEDANIINDDPHLSVQVNTNGSRFTFMLVIRDLTVVDMGIYSCTVKKYGVDNSAWPEKSTFLSVKTPPEIQVNQMPSVQNVDLGSSLNITCEASGFPNPNITWEYVSGYKHRGTQLTLTNIQKNDRGIYTCVADNGISPSARHEVDINVYFPPSCTPLHSVVGQAQNRRFNAKMVCVVEGYPEPNVKWIKETEYGRLEIEDDDKYEITKQYGIQLERNTFWSVLKVRNVQANDYGDYVCVADNVYGIGSANITLIETLDCQGTGCPSLP